MLQVKLCETVLGLENIIFKQVPEIKGFELHMILFWTLLGRVLLLKCYIVNMEKNLFEEIWLWSWKHKTLN